MSENNNKITTLSCQLFHGERTAVGEEVCCEVRMDGVANDLCAAYAAMTIRLLEVIETNCEPGFVPVFYGMAQRMIAENSCLGDRVKVFEVGEDVAKRFGPLLNLMGKTFTIPNEEEGAE